MKLARRLTTALILGVSGTEQITCESVTVCAETNLLQVPGGYFAKKTWCPWKSFQYALWPDDLTLYYHPMSFLYNVNNEWENFIRVHRLQSGSSWTSVKKEMCTPIHAAWSAADQHKVSADNLQLLSEFLIIAITQYTWAATIYLVSSVPSSSLMTPGLQSVDSNNTWAHNTTGLVHVQSPRWDANSSEQTISALLLINTPPSCSPVSVVPFLKQQTNR